MTASEKLRRNVRLKRKERGLTQRALAERAELYHSHIHSIETGRLKKITVPTAERIANGLGVPIAELFEDVPKAA